VLTDLKRAKFIYLLIFQWGFKLVKVSKGLPKFLFAFDLRIVEAAVEYKGDLMRGRSFSASLKVGSQELNAFLMIQEATIFIEIVHLRAQLNENIDLTGLGEEVKLSVRKLDYSSKTIMVLRII
jgi:hypothetical protein